MKKIVTSLLFLLCSVLYAQRGGGDQESQGFDYTKELERQVKIPNTPEAQAFAKYGNTSVSMYSGTPNISVPIYTIAGREINVPLSLTYDASGIKVNQMATQAGLGWNLNAAGRISRTANGLVDDYNHSVSVYGYGYPALGNKETNATIIGLSSGGSTEKTLKELVDMYKNSPTTFDELEDGKQYFNFLKDLADNRFDTQPDYFSFNALGYSDTFVYDPVSDTFVALKNPRTKVTANYSSGGFSLESWVVTTDNGTKFYFEEVEKTRTQHTDDESATIIAQDYNSSWVLTKIVSPHAKDEYLFEYNDIAKTDQESYHISSVTNTMKPGETQIDGQVNYVGISYEFEAKVLKKITHNGHEIVNINFKERVDQKLAEYDTNGSAIDFISIYKRHDTDTATPENDVLKQFQFHHSYFGISSSANPATYKNTPWMLRLKLDRIDIQSGTNSTLSSYHFDYISPESVPSRISLAQDYLGLYNGANNDVLYASLPFYTPLGGANREPAFNAAIKGTLSKITYPTGGYTVFEYEPHTVPLDSDATNGAYPSEQHAVFSINGGVDNNNAYMQNTCMIAIDEEFSLSETSTPLSYGLPPVIGATNFVVTEAGSYHVDLEKISNARGVESYEAYIVQRSEATNLAANDTYSYDEIIDIANCTPRMPLLYSRKADGNQKNLVLTEGTYQIILVKGIVKDTRGGQNSLHLSVSRFTGDLEGALDGAPIIWLGTGEQAKAGIRVKDIKDYSSENVLASQKEYKYTATPEGNDSTGKEVFKPVFHTIQRPQEDDGITTVIQHSSFSNGDRPHVAYHRVFEIQKNNTTNNGYQVHDFNVGIYNGVSNDVGANYYRNDFKVGKQNRLSIFNQENELQAQDKTDYIDTEYYVNSTIYLSSNLKNQGKFILFKEDNTGQNDWRYTYIPPVYRGMSTGENPNPSLPESIAQEPDICRTASTFCFYPEYATLAVGLTYAKGRTGGELRKKSRQIFNNKITATETDYLYYTTGTNPNYLLKESKTITSVNDTLKQEFLYPDQLSEYNALVNANMLTNPVETNTYKASVPLSKQKTVYSGTLPSKVQTAKGGSDLEDRIFFERYANNNAVQVKQADGTTTAYIWGYWHSQPIAKIDNATYAQVENYVSNLQNLSNQDDDRTLGSVGNEGKLRTALNNLRNLQTLSNAQVTSYTYDPLIGVTSITDPRGNTAYYTYDAHHRLQFVKDKDGNILKENKYNYKN